MMKNETKAFLKASLLKFNESALPYDEPSEVISFRLVQNYPNPFNTSTTIIYEIPQPSEISIKIYDVLGKEAGLLVSGFKNPGSYKVDFNASHLASGIYYYQLRTEKEVQSKKMMLLK